MTSILRSSKFVRHFVNLARSIVISNRQEVDGSLIQRSQNLIGLFPNSFSSTASNHVQYNSLEQTVRRLDEDARRTGRISMSEVEEALNEIRQIKKATTSQSLMVIRCCGNLVPEETPERRTQLVQEIWNTLEKLGVPLDISHFNALLKVYLENEHKFSPTEFLAKLEKQGIEPNRVTYQRLISGYCQLGDIAGATKILEYMKEKQLPVSEGVFNALILGHSKADDMKSAEGILSVMKQANLEPSSETYTALLCAYAHRGDKEAVERLIKDCKLKDVLLSDRDFLEVAYRAAINGHDELYDVILTNIRNMIGYNQDAVNVLLRLITNGKDEAAYKVFMTMQPAARTTGNSPNMSGHILIKHYVKSKRPLEQILSLCDRLAKDGHTTRGLLIAIENSFATGNVDLTLALIKLLKKRNEPIRQHYFWPSLVSAGKTGNVTRMNAILKQMVDEFDLPPNFETLRDYYLPYVPQSSADEILQKLMELGVRRGQAVTSLCAHLISENKMKPAVKLASQHSMLNMRAVFANRQLLEALQKTNDVKSVVALVHLIANNKTPDQQLATAEEDEEVVTAEDIPGRFLTSVISFAETREKVAAVLKEMVELGLSISGRCAEAVESRLQGNQLTPEISSMLSKLSSGELTPAAIKTTASPVGSTPLSRNPAALERIKEKIIANNEPQESVLSITRSIFQAYCFNEDLENALRVKKEWVDDLKQELTPGWWAQLLPLYCTQDDVEGAKQCLEEVKKLSEEFEMDITKVVRVAKMYIQHNKLDDALQLINDAKPREEKGFQSRAMCFQALAAVADQTKDPEKVRLFFQTLLDKKYIEVSNVFLGPLIKAHILRDDVEGALKEFENCVKLYRATPWKNEIATRLIEKEDAVNLQTLVDLSTQVHGEINSLYDLVLSFIECGRVRQARKILETPGLRARNTRLQAACERYRNEGSSAPLERLIEATKDLTYIDRSEIYYNLLETYCQADNVDKALGLWTQMQDEDVHVSDQFLVRLGGFLKSKGQHVPFEIPNLRPADREVKKPDSPKSLTSVQYSSPGLSAAVKAKNVEEALKFKESVEKGGRQLTKTEATNLLELLVQQNRFKEAANLFVSLKDTSIPNVRTLNFFVSRLSMAGDLDLMNQVGERFSEDLKRLTSFGNRYLSCAVSAGKGKEELSKLEKQIDNASTTEEIDSLTYTFPRGGIFALLSASPSFLEPVERIADKYYDKGVNIPANCLCMYYMGEEQFDKARELFHKYKLQNSSRIMFQSVLSAARIKENPRLIEELISLLKDSPGITPEIKGLMYSNMINIHIRKGESETALSKLEDGLKSTPLENFHHSTLVNLKESLESKNIPFKYTIPPRKIREKQSTSSSSSDEEPKKSVAAH